MYSIILKLLLSLPYLLVTLSFFGFSLNWAHESYDSWRLTEILVVFIILLFSLLKFYQSHIFLSIKQISVIVFLGIMIGISIYQANNPTLGLLDFCWSLSLLVFFYTLVLLQKKLSIEILEKYISAMALSPIWVIIWLLVGYYLYLTASVPLVWHGLFVNIRYYDDALLPCLFLLWYQPSFLKRYPKAVIFLSSLYLLTLWLDAARANWLSILFALSLVAAFYQQGYKKVALPVLSIVLSLIWYKTLMLLEPQIANYTVIRNDSHVRATMWLGSIKTWLDNPIWGIGGANFVTLDNSINLETVGHPHNLFFQLLVEWGIVGLVIIIIILVVYYQMFSQRRKIPAMLLAGAIALLINSLLSGAYIYPISQMAMLIFFSCVAYYINIPIRNLSSDSVQKKKIKLYPAWIGLLTITIVIAIIAKSFFQYGTIMVDTESSWGPRFWSNAKVTNLKTQDEEVIK